MYNLGTLIALAERQDRMAGRSSRRQHFLTTSDRLWSYGKNLISQSARVSQDVKICWGSYLKRQYRTGNAVLEVCYSWSKKDFKYLQDKLNSIPHSLFPSAVRVKLDADKSSELATSLISQNVRNGSFQSLEIKVLSPSFIPAALDFLRAAKGRNTLTCFALDLDMGNDDGVSDDDMALLFADLKRILCHGNCCIKRFSFNCNQPLSAMGLSSLWAGLAKNQIEALDFGLQQRDSQYLSSVEGIMNCASFPEFLRHLSLKGSDFLSIHDAGDRLGELLNRHPRLEKLVLKDKQEFDSQKEFIQPSTMALQPFADAIVTHQSLRELSIELHSSPTIDPQNLGTVLLACARQKHCLQSCLIPRFARLHKTSNNCSINSHPKVSLTIARCLDSSFVYKMSEICQFITNLHLFLNESGNPGNRQQGHEQNLHFLRRILENPHCQVNDLTLSRCSEDGIQQLTRGLENYAGLQALTLDQCSLSEDQLNDLHLSLASSSSGCFERLTLHDAGLDMYSIPVIADFLKSFPNLRVLDLATNKLLSQSNTFATQEIAAREANLLEALQDHYRLQRFHVKASFGFHLCVQQVLQRNQVLNRLLQDPTQACTLPSALRPWVVQRLGRFSGHNALFLFATEIPEFWSL